MFVHVCFSMASNGEEESDEHITAWPCPLPVYKPSMAPYCQPGGAHTSQQGTQSLPGPGPTILSSSVPLLFLPTHPKARNHCCSRTYSTFQPTVSAYPGPCAGNAGQRSGGFSVTRFCMVLSELCGSFCLTSFAWFFVDKAAT